MPFISGKDSLNNEFHAADRNIVIPPTLLISALGRVPDIRQCVTMDLKEPGNLLFLLGVTRDVPPSVPGDIWVEFAKARVHPDLANIHFIARAITPPRRPRRFDTRFFTADASSLAHKIEGVVGPDSELVELVWVPITEATKLDMPTITGVVLEELAARVEAGMAHSLPVPFYFMADQQFFRELL